MSMMAPVTGEFPAQRASNAKNASFDDVIMKQYNAHQNRMHIVGSVSVVRLPY